MVKGVQFELAILVTKIVNIENLRPIMTLIVKAVAKGVGPDIQTYLVDNNNETNNAIRFLRNDKINTNLRNTVVSDTIGLHPFKRHGWDGRILIDRKKPSDFQYIVKTNIKRNSQKRTNRLSPTLPSNHITC